ncbi:MAG TPA: type II toxin-antitoxin system prevent-host-death family antitoxin [Candidatus Kryptonia bacterium]|nr:type II toxin-antitoxin system prevent-host-death family antitoxin [Candidatus Kryptonia bacterium]
MKTMLISDFKAKCIAVLKDVERSGDPVVVTLRGRPIVRVEPFSAGAQRKQLGSLKGRMRIHRDLVRSDTTRDWEVLK